MFNKIRNWLKPQSLYILAASSDDESFVEVLAYSSWEKAQKVRDVLVRQYGGSNVVVASRRIDDTPYLIQRRLLIDRMTERSAGLAK